jgi:hypothetical protein
MLTTALCSVCKIRPAILATRPLKCRRCLALEAVAKRQKPKPTRRNVMRDWQRPLERR